MHFPSLYIYDEESNYLSSISSSSDEFRDAVWTPRGRIAFATKTNKIVIIEETSQVISYTQKMQPNHFSVFKDDVIYLTDLLTGIFQSQTTVSVGHLSSNHSMKVIVFNLSKW